jgi:outer membrane receptor protein involved in Fe transport
MKLTHRYFPTALLASAVSAIAALPTGAWAQDVNSATGMATDGAARSTLDEIVVTARKKSEVLQAVPMSVSALDAEQLKDKGISSLDDLSVHVPGLQQGDLAITSRLTLRGVNSGDNNAFEQSVGTYVDGVYRGRMNQQHIGLFDIERIEVLKGPQVALYGNSSLGGAISVITRQPEFEFSGDLRYRHGLEYNEPLVEAGVDVPLNDQFVLRFAGIWSDQRDGLFPNDATGDSEPSRQNEAARLSALWLPNAALSIALRHEQGRFERNGNIFDVYKHVDGQGNPWPDSHFTGLNDGRLNIANGDPFKYQDSFLANDMAETRIEIQYQFEAATLTSISGYSEYDYRQSADVDITPATLINVYQDEDFSQFSQEFRIAGEWTETVDYLAGLYLQSDDFRNDYLSDFNLPELVAPVFGIPSSLAADLIHPFSRHILIDQQTEQWALFGNLDFALTDRLTASFGYRYLMIDKDARQAVRVANIDHVDGVGELIDVRWLSPELAPLLLGNAAYLADPTGYVLVLPDGTAIPPVLAPNNVVGYSIVSNGAGDLHQFDDLSREEQHPMYQLSLAYQWTDDLLAYGNWSNGAKAGGFDFLYEGDDRSQVEYGDESASVFEIGFKKDWEKVRLNVAAFYGSYDDLQVSVFDGGIGFLVGNAASSISRGIDVDLDWHITRELTLFTRLGYLDFRHDEFRDANCSTTERLNTGQAVCDWSGDRAPFVPEFEGVLGIEYSHRSASDWLIEHWLGWSYSGSHSTASDNEPQTRQSAYGLLDYRVELTPGQGHWSVAVLGKNLTDETYNVFTSVIPLAPGGAFASVRGKGREVSLELQYRF